MGKASADADMPRAYWKAVISMQSGPKGLP